MDAEERLSSMRDYWGTYHHHKEQMAFGATALYLSAATAVILNANDVWAHVLPHYLVVKLFMATVVLGFAFVYWQLKNRETAAGVVYGCNQLLSGAQPSDSEKKASEGRDERRDWRGVPLPPDLARRLDDLTRSDGFFSGPRTAAFITLSAMVVWTLGAILALYFAARGAHCVS